jgi:hypothetical protein
MIMRCLVKLERLFNSTPRARPRDLANQALRYGTVYTTNFSLSYVALVSHRKRMIQENEAHPDRISKYKLL